MACYEILRRWDFGLVDAVLTDVGRDEASVTNRVTRSFNKLLGSNLHLFTLYGREFLSPAAFANRLEEHLTGYYSYLARSRFERREPAFWDFHRSVFAECGLELEGSRVWRTMWSELRQNPRWMLRNLVYSLIPEKAP
jgi:hypothetical protein